MDDDLVFRLLFLALFLPGAVIRGYYARRVRTTHINARFVND